MSLLFLSFQFLFPFCFLLLHQDKYIPTSYKHIFSRMHLSACLVFGTEALYIVFSLTFKIKVNKIFLTLCVCTKSFKIQSGRRPPWVGL